MRKAAIQLLSIAAHNKAGLVREQLQGLLPALYQQTIKDPSLIRVVELGPFQHQIDDGLELRKATFECMDVLLENAGDKLLMPDFIKHLASGLQVNYLPENFSYSSALFSAGCTFIPYFSNINFKPKETK